MDSIAIMAESRKGHDFAIPGPTEKNTGSLSFCTDATYKILSSSLKRFRSNPIEYVYISSV